MHAGHTLNVPITMTNTGSQIWPNGGANPVNLSYHWLNASTGAVVTWDGERTPLPSNISSGQMVSVNATLKASPLAGSYNLLWDMIQEGIAWFSTQGAPSLYIPGITVNP